MKVSVEHYTQHNVSWDAAKRIALIISDSFQKDFSREEFYPEKYNFSRPLPEIYDYNELISRAHAFKELVEATARHVYILMRSDNRVQTFMFTELDGKETTYGAKVFDVGMSLWRLPEYVHVESKISFWHKLETMILKLMFKFQDWWTFGCSGNPIYTPALIHEFQLGYKHCNARETPERIRELESMSGDELANIAYPATYNYRLSQFCVTSAAQGNGYGRYIMEESIARLRQMTIKDPPNLRGPAKIGFFSAPDAREFYKKCGFSVGAVWNHKVPSGRTLPHTFFFMNLT